MVIKEHMLLNIYSLQNDVIRKDAKSVSVKTPKGEITVLENHEALITPIETGDIRLVDKAGNTESVPAHGGFIEVRPNSAVGGEVNILVK